jgi:hypothetical protein
LFNEFFSICLWIWNMMHLLDRNSGENSRSFLLLIVMVVAVEELE